MGLIVYGGDSPEVRAQEVKIRKDNDFKLIFLVERNGNPENMEVAAITSLNLIGPSSTVPIAPVSIEDNILYMDIDSSLNQVLGKYSLELKYAIPDNEFTGGVRDCAVDTYAYTIVGSSSEATKIDELAKTVDVATGFQGKAFTYGMYTPEQIAELQRPALEAAILANNAVMLAENAANGAISAKIATETAIQNANNATNSANSAATFAQQEGGKATLAASQASSSASIASQNAERARQEAENAERAAGAADQARVTFSQAIQTELQTADQKILELDQARYLTISATQSATHAAETATTQGNLAESKANLANNAATLANAKATEANDAAQAANTATGLADTARINLTNSVNSKLEEADGVITAAQTATTEAIEAKDMVLANVIGLELRDDMCLWMITPDTYEGITFKVENGDLIAIIQ